MHGIHQPNKNKNPPLCPPLPTALYQGLHLRVDRAVPRSSRLEAATNRFDKKSHTDKNKNNSAAASQTNALPAAYDPSRSVFVGNLHFETQDEEVICLFNESEDMGDLVGQVEAVRCVRDGATHVGKGIAFVLFKDKVCEGRGSVAGKKQVLRDCC